MATGAQGGHGRSSCLKPDRRRHLEVSSCLVGHELSSNLAVTTSGQLVVMALGGLNPNDS